jgi:hypothetical protein
MLHDSRSSRDRLISWLKLLLAELAELAEIDIGRNYYWLTWFLAENVEAPTRIASV